MAEVVERPGCRSGPRSARTAATRECVPAAGVVLVDDDSFAARRCGLSRPRRSREVTVTILHVHRISGLSGAEVVGVDVLHEHVEQDRRCPDVTGNPSPAALELGPLRRTCARNAILLSPRTRRAAGERVAVDGAGERDHAVRTVGTNPMGNPTCCQGFELEVRRDVLDDRGRRDVVRVGVRISRSATQPSGARAAGELTADRRLLREVLSNSAGSVLCRQ